MTGQGFIYWVRAPNPGHIKIGFSTNPTKRLEQLRIGSPVPLELVGLKVGCIEDEQALHKQLQAYRLHGEWFSETVAVLKSVEPMPKSPDEIVGWVDRQISVHPHRFQKQAQITTLMKLVTTIRSQP